MSCTFLPLKLQLIWIHNIFADNGAVLYTDPFSCCVLPNFVKDDHFLESLKDELLDQIFIEKNNDLYKFQQVREQKNFWGNIYAFTFCRVNSHMITFLSCLISDRWSEENICTLCAWTQVGRFVFPTLLKIRLHWDFLRDYHWTSRTVICWQK